MTKEDVRKKTRLMVLQLDYQVKEEELKRIFGAAGTVLHCHLFLRGDGTSAGRATVLYSSREEAGRAIDAFNRQVIGNRKIKVEPFEENRAKRRGYDEWDLSGRNPRTTQHQRSRMMKRRLDQSRNYPYRNICKTSEYAQ